MIKFNVRYSFVLLGIILMIVSGCTTPLPPPKDDVDDDLNLPDVPLPESDLVEVQNDTVQDDVFHENYSNFLKISEGFNLNNNLITFSDDAIYKKAYYSINGSAWQEFLLEGEQYTSNEEWIKNVATATLNSNLQNVGEHYLIFFSCTKEEDNWNCHGPQNHTNYWQLKIIKITQEPEEPPEEPPIQPPEEPEEMHYIVENNVGRAQIIISPNAPSSVNLAADLLQKRINNMTGAMIPIKTEVDDNIPFKIFLGQSTYTDALGVDDTDCKYGSFKMVTGDDYLILLGNDDVTNITGPHNLAGRGGVSEVQNEWDAITGENWDTPYSWVYKYYNSKYDLWATDNKGTMNAVYEFLYDQGIRWYYPGAIGTIIPSKKDIYIKDVNEHIKPDFAMRHYETYFRDYYQIHLHEGELEYQLSLRTNFDEVIGIPIDHGTKLVINRDEVKANHPEYYAIWDGVRMNGNKYHPDLCSEGLFNQQVAYARKIFDVYDVPSVSVSPTDGFWPGVSESSPECLAKRTLERGTSGHISDYVWEYVNNVALEVYKTHPDKKILGAAYAGSLLTPEKIDQLAPNVVVYVARWRARFYDPEYEQKHKDITDAWLEILPSKEIYLREYYIYNRPGGVYESIPVFFTQAISRDLKFYKGISNGEYVEVNRNSYDSPLPWDEYAANALNVYITSRLYWDADQDVNALLDEYYDLFYGPASQEMKAFVEYAEANYGEARNNPKILVNLRNMAMNARAIAGNTIYGERIDLLIGLMNSRYVGEETTIDSCMKLDSPSTTYKLTQDVTSTGTCFTFAENGVTLDCQGHKITYATNQGNYNGINIKNFRDLRPVDYFTVKNCVIENGAQSAASAIYVQSANNGVIENNIIDVADSENSIGLYLLSSNNVTSKDNTITSAGSPFFVSFMHNSLIADNNATTVSSRAMYHSYSNNTVVKNNVLSSISDYGVHMAASYNNNFTNNIIKSDTQNALWLYVADDNIFINNTAISKDNIGIRLYTSANRNQFIEQTAIGGTYGIDITSSSDNIFKDCNEITGGTENLRTSNSDNVYENCNY